MQQLIDINERIQLFKELTKMGAVHIGSSAYNRTGKNPKMDIDLAVTNKIIIEFLQNNKYSILHRVHYSGIATRTNNSVKYSNKEEVIMCNYSKNENTLWLSTNKIIWKSGISMDLLFYDENVLPAVKDTIDVMLKIPKIWEDKNKNKRVKLYEILVKSFN